MTRSRKKSTEAREKAREERKNSGKSFGGNPYGVTRKEAREQRLGLYAPENSNRP
jgi:hypothetical protein